jgi:hypothetical protein
MTKKQMLEKLELYNGTVIADLCDVLKCKCRFYHKFDYKTIDEWCAKCDTVEFNQEIFNEVNAELIDLDSNFTVVAINKYGICEFVCQSDHISVSDIDELPNECKNCNVTPTVEFTNVDLLANDDSKQASSDSMMWGNTITPKQAIPKHSKSNYVKPSIKPKYCKPNKSTEFGLDNNSLDRLYIIHPMENKHIKDALNKSKFKFH